MKAKLIKVNDNQLDVGFYILRDLNGNPIALECNLSLKNCQSIERGFDLDEIVEQTKNTLEDCRISSYESFKIGFQKALELMGDKKFSEDDVRNAYLEGANQALDFNPDSVIDENKAIQSLQITEWDVTILMEKDEPKSFVKRKVIRKLDNGEEIEWTCFWDNGWFSAVGIKIPNVISWEKLPILDSDGCLILKPIK